MGAGVGSGWVGKQAKPAGREPVVCGFKSRSNHSVFGCVVQWQDAGLTYRKRWFNSIRDHWNAGERSHGSVLCNGSVVQRQGAGMTCRRGWFDSIRDHF